MLTKMNISLGPSGCFHTHKADTYTVNVDKNKHLARAERVVFTHKADSDTINVDKLTMKTTPV